MGASNRPAGLLVNSCGWTYIHVLYRTLTENIVYVCVCVCVHDSLFNAGIMEIDEGIPPICKTHGQVCEQKARNQGSVVDGLATSQKSYSF